MAVSFNVPKSPSKSILTIDTFQGCDFTNSPANVDEHKSPNAVYMIRDVPGKVRKSMGYETVMTYKDGNDEPLAINGFHLLRGDANGFIHAGESIFWDRIWLYDSANNARSKAWQFENKLYMLDGKKLLTMYSEKVGDGTSSTGEHKTEVDGISYTETLTLKNGDFVNFYMPYECDHVDIEYDGNTVTVSLSDATTYKFENTYGDYEFSFTFYATLETTTDDTPVSTDIIGTGTQCVFSGSVKSGVQMYIEKIWISYTEDGERQRIEIIPDTDVTSYTWTNNIGDYEFSFSVLSRGFYNEFNVPDSTHEVDISDITGGLSTLSVAPGQEITFLVDSDTYFRTGFTIEISYYCPDDPEPRPHIQDTMTGYAEIDWRNRYIKNMTIYAINLTVLDDAENARGSITTPSIEWKGSISYQNTYGYGGTHTSVINSELVNGFVDDRSNTYVDEYGYRHYVKRVEDDAYIPLVTISKDPSGGGTPHNDLNLLTPAFIEQFLAQEDPNTHVWPKNYHLSFTGLDEVEPKVWLLDANGEWDLKEYGTDYTCDYANGIIKFTTAPGASPVEGEDNVKVEAYRTIEGYADQINKCTIGILYGVNGASDRLFVSGNPDYINRDWYSWLNDPTYFPDTSYSVLGTSGSAIIGYSIISNYLAAHKDWMERDQNIILREGDLVDSEPSFRIINTLQGAGAIAPFSFAYLATEPLFLTRQGVFAVTAQDITGEKYAQNRSYFLDGKLLKEQNLDNAYAFVYQDMYWLCLNNVAYILDGLQPIRTDTSMPYATRQYAGFYRTNLPARIMWEKDEKLYFGTEDGRVCVFFTDKYSLDSYSDDGEPIEAIWETPDIDGKLFYKNKTLRYIALRLDSALATSVNIFVMNRGLWQFIKKDDTSGRYLSFSHLVFSKLSFSGDKTQHTISTKVRVKKVDKFRLRLVNDELNEPFGLFNIAFEYVENGNYKG